MSTRVRFRALPVFLVIVLGASPGAGAAGVHVEDPRGDVRLSGAPLGPGFEWADLLQGGFRQDEDQLVAWLRVAGTEPPKGSGEFGLVFSVGKRSFMIGYTVAPPYYEGSFFCTFDGPADLQADYSCKAGNGTLAAGNLTVRVEAATVGLNATPKVHSPWAWSEANYNKPGERLRLDTTSVGRNFTWALGGPNATQDPGPADPVDPASVPAPGILLAAAALLLPALRRSRGRA